LGFIIFGYLDKSPTESLIKYFIVQSIASSFLYIIFVIREGTSSFMENYFSFFLVIGLLLKSGVAPLHFWLPLVTNSIPWLSLLVVLSWQKLSPIFVIRIIEIKIFLVKLIIVLGGLWGSILGFIQINMKILLVYSSISHSPWILIILWENLNFWFIYWLIYRFNLVVLIYFIIKFNNIQDLYLSSSNNNLNLIFIISLLSLGGFPPFLGFLAKWVVIINITNYILIFILILSSTINMYFYMRLRYSFLIINNLSYTLNFSLKQFRFIIFVLPISIFLIWN